MYVELVNTCVVYYLFIILHNVYTVHGHCYTIQILYNTAYGESQLKNTRNCLSNLQKGQELASGVSETRNRIICNALDCVKVRREGEGEGGREGERG